MLPLPIRALRDAVVVLAALVIGGTIAELPYGESVPDSNMVWTFQAVSATLAFAVTGYMTPSRRGLQMALAVLIAWLLTGVVVATGPMHPAWWVFLLPGFALMALLGGGLALLVERFARD